MKRLLLPLITLVVLVVGTYLLLPVLFPVNSLREKIEENLNQQITGKAEIVSIRLSTFPWLGIRINNLTIKNDERFQKSELLKVNQAGVKIKVMPLLSGKILGEILIDQPIIRLETLADGRTSLAALMRVKPAAAPEKAKDEKKESTFADRALEALQIKSLTLNKGELRTITYNTKNEAKTGTDINQLHLHVENFALKGEVPLRLSAALFNRDHKDFDFEGLLVTDLNPSGSKQTVTIKSGSLNFGDILLRVDGVLNQAKNSPMQVDLNIKSEGISLGRLGKNLPILKEKLPEGLEGDLSFTATAKGPTEPIEGLMIHMDLASNRLATGSGQKIELQNTKISSSFHQNVLTLKSLTTNTYEGTVSSQGTITLPGPKVDLTVAVKELDLNEALNHTSDKKDLLFGKLNLNAQIKGNLSEPGEKHPAAIVPGWLLSSGHLAIGKGKLASLNLLGDTTKALVKIAPISPEARKLLETLNWDSIDADFRTEKSFFYLEPLTIKYDHEGALASGSINPEAKLNFKGDLTLDKKVADLLGGSFLYLTNPDGRVILPFRITGKIDKPITYIDIASILKKAVKQEITKVVPPDVKNLFGELLKKPETK